ncbi:hypothetical protein OHC33_010607 [Knufia fluminis]|uniref:Anaphase-promoting complex subunit 4 n=1 Tax=Knufia fluminis TaxID=191047 RepID=A0AAN8EN46_9EURO|nr:hypothetical protein OHC33_010607 [Knufia fluminis]
MQLIGTNLLPMPIGPTRPGAKDGLASEFGLKYCPTMDLVAVFPRILASESTIDAVVSKVPSADNYTGEDDEEVLVDVYRLNGQKVFTISIESDNGATGVVDVAWRSDGVILTIVTCDNTTRLVNSFSGKIVHTFSSLSSLPPTSSSSSGAPKSPSSKRKSIDRNAGSNKRRCMPTSVFYSTHFTAPQTASQQLDAAKQEKGTSLDDLLSLNADIDQLLKLNANLPKELANLDVEQFLPKLATLPSNGMGEDDVFSTRTSIDTMFHPAKQNAGSISADVVAVAQSDSHIHLRVFDSFEVGDVDLNRALNTPTGCTFGMIRHIVTHPFSEKIYAIVEERHGVSRRRQTRSHDASEDTSQPLHLLSLDLRFIRQSSHTLPILATKATQLHNLIRYLRQIESQLAREVKTAFDLPGRFIRTLEEDLKEQDGEGSTFETSAYHVMLTGEVHGKFKEWLVDILGERGVKRWEKAVYECLELVRRLISENWNPAVERAGIVVSRLTGLAAASSTFDIDKRVLDGLRDTIDIMAVVGEDLLRDTNAEIAGFNAFIKWLKREVEMAGLEDTSEKLDEMRESSDHSEVRKVLKYVSERLQDTSVKKYIREGQATGTEDEDELDTYNKFKQARQADTESSLSPSMNTLTTRLTGQCDRLFQQVGTRLRENVLAQYMCKLTDDMDGEVMDSRIVHQPEYAVLHILGRRSTGEGQICWLRKTLDATSARSNVSSKSVVIEGAKEILDIKIVDDEEAMILTRTSTQMKVMSLRLQDDIQQAVRHTFGGRGDPYTQAGLRPWKLEINGRKLRRTITVLDEQGRGYGVFDLDSAGGAGHGEDESMSG